MATAPTFKLSTDWVDLNTLAAVAVGSRMIVENQGKTSDFLEVVASTTKPERGASGRRIDSNDRFEIQSTLTLWGRYIRFTSTSGIDNQLLPVAIEGVSDLIIKPVSSISNMIASEDSPYPRVRVSTFSVVEQYIVDGLGQSWSWYETAIPSGGERYCEIIIPAGYYMALEERLLNPEKDHIFYRVWEEGNYSIDTVGAGLPVSNLRSDSALEPTIAHRVTVTAQPDNALKLFQVSAFGVEGTGSGSRASGDIKSSNVFRLYAPNERLLLQLANEGNSASDVSLSLIYGLVPADKVPPSLT